MKSATWSGAALIGGGVVTMFVNAVLSPMMPYDAPFAELASSTVFLWRLALAALGVLLLLLGFPGLLHRAGERLSLVGGCAFAVAFVGTALLFAHEWSQVFFVRPLAFVAPDALQAMEDVKGPDAFEIEGIVVLAVFTLGWIALSIALIVGRTLSLFGPLLIIAGFFAIPILTVSGLGLWGAILGNVVLSSGWIVLGRGLMSGADKPRLL